MRVDGDKHSPLAEGRKFQVWNLGELNAYWVPISVWQI